MAEPTRMTCPNCQNGLKIPAGWEGKAVKCRKCGVVVRAGKPAVAKRVQPVIPPAASSPAAAPPPSPNPDPASPSAFVPVGYTPAQPGDDWFPEPEFGAVSRYRQRGSGSGKFVWIGFAIALTAALVGGAIAFKDKLPGAAAERTTPPATDKAAPPTVKTAAPALSFPRRMLVLSVAKYLYCNGLTAGSPSLKQNGDHVTEVARRLAFEWRVPTDKENNQLYVVSDTTGRDPRPMVQPVIRQAYERFFDTSRPQDRIAVYFGGHAVEKGGKAYLVPVDGDPTDPATLIPLDDFYARLKACPAHQKVVLFDVCRLNEADDMVRPGSEPMTPELERALLAAPAGVQVALTCSAGQRALEYRSAPSDAPEVAGSLFLSALKWVAAKGKVKGGLDQKPEDPIPVTAWVEAAKARAAEVAQLTGKPAPTPKLAGGEPGPAEPAADAPPAARLVIPAPPAGMRAEDVRRLFNLADLPPLRPSEAATEEPLESVLPFAADAMAPFAPDGVPVADIKANPDKYPIRAAAVGALEFVRKEWGKAAGDAQSGSKLMDRFDAATDDAVKKLIRGEQEAPARIILELEERSRAMDALLPELEKEPSRYWKVMFQFALAEVKTRLAFMHEYDNALAAIVTDSLPERDPKKHSGLQLVSSEKMRSKKDVKDIAEEARELYSKITAENPGTPWAVQARRAKVAALGLVWQPLPKTVMTRDE